MRSFISVGRLPLSLSFFMICIILSATGAMETLSAQKAGEESFLQKALIERYILDELKDIRRGQDRLKTEMVERVSQARLDAADRAIRYTADTVNIIFFIITAAATILVIMGWSSFRQIRKQMEATVNVKITHLTREYESRLKEVEDKLKVRTEQIISAQEEIGQANQVHALWMRAALETSLQEKIKLYDAILEINSQDVEAITYKADVTLEMGEIEWALHLANKAVELDQTYGLAYWQRACANAELGYKDEAISDIATAVEHSPSLKSDINAEVSFKHLKDSPEFQALLQE